jgi:hypothetical protein
MVNDAGFFISFQAVHEFGLSILGDKAGESPHPGFIQHGPGAREIMAFPTSLQAFLFTAFEVLAPFLTGAAFVPASGTCLIMAADTASQAAISKTFCPVHFLLPTRMMAYYST